MSETDALSAAIAKVIDRHKDEPSISPSWVATEAMKLIGFASRIHPVGYIGCHLQLRQLSRQQLGKKFDPVDLATEDEMFPETLQKRYPLRPRPGEEPVYILLENLPDEDAAWNVVRMRRQSLALQKHSDALEAWRISRKLSA